MSELSELAVEAAADVLHEYLMGGRSYTIPELARAAIAAYDSQAHAEGYRAGQEAMRDKAEKLVRQRVMVWNRCDAGRCALPLEEECEDIATAIRALPLAPGCLSLTAEASYLPTTQDGSEPVARKPDSSKIKRVF